MHGVSELGTQSTVESDFKDLIRRPELQVHELSFSVQSKVSMWFPHNAT
jgi:hypothetical protein